MATRSQRRANAAGRAANSRAQNRGTDGRFTVSHAPVDPAAVAKLRGQVDADTAARSRSGAPTVHRSARSDRWVTFGPFALLPRIPRRRGALSASTGH